MRFLYIEKKKKKTILVMLFGKLLTATRKYNRIYEKRFQGLTHKELKFCVKEQFKEIFEQYPNLRNPKTFWEKLNWIKLYYDNPLMTICADKIKGRDYFVEKVFSGKNHLVKQYGVYKSAEEVDFAALPNEFVLKSNWGSGHQIIVKDKSSLNIPETKQKMEEWLERTSNHYFTAFEQGYKNIEPHIVCEEFLNFEYKLEFFCFNGEPRFFWIVKNDKTKEVQANFYELDWKRMPVSNKYPNFEEEVVKPACYEELLENAKKMCGDFPFVRCDFYVTKDGYRFSEMTFFHWAGLQTFTPSEYNTYVGEMMKLPKRNRGNKV